MGKKLVKSDFTHKRVENPTKITEKQEKKVKRYVREFFEKAVEKRKILDAKNAEKTRLKALNGEPSDHHVNGVTNGRLEIHSPLGHEDSIDMTPSSVMDSPRAPGEPHSQINDDSSTPADASSFSDGLKRKRSRDDLDLDTPTEDSESNKRLKEDTEDKDVDVSPPPPPPPPPAGEMPPAIVEETEEEKELRKQEEELMKESEEAMKMDLDGNLHSEEEKLQDQIARMIEREGSGVDVPMVEAR